MPRIVRAAMELMARDRSTKLAISPMRIICEERRRMNSTAPSLPQRPDAGFGDSCLIRIVGCHILSLELFGDGRGIGPGKTIFDANCVACHGPDGAGAIPRRRNSRTLNSSPVSPHDVLQRRTSGKGIMPAWQSRLSSDERWAAVEYARSFAYNRPATSRPNTNYQRSGSILTPEE